jgi:cysteine desulfuration protein SufE
MVVKGYLSILIQALNGLSTEDLLIRSQSLVEHFGEVTNIRANLTPSRANAFGNIYQLMRVKAGDTR